MKRKITQGLNTMITHKEENHTGSQHNIQT